MATLSLAEARSVASDRRRQLGGGGAAVAWGWLANVADASQPYRYAPELQFEAALEDAQQSPRLAEAIAALAGAELYGVLAAAQAARLRAGNGLPIRKLAEAQRIAAAASGSGDSAACWRKLATEPTEARRSALEDALADAKRLGSAELAEAVAVIAAASNDSLMALLGNGAAEPLRRPIRRLAETRKVASDRSRAIAVYGGYRGYAFAWARLAAPSPPAASDFGDALTDTDALGCADLAGAVAVIASAAGDSAAIIGAEALARKLREASASDA